MLESHTKKKSYSLIYFDIITTTKNSDDVIKKTLYSVSNQTYSNINHIIVDGNSTDKTIKIIQEFHHQKNIVIYQEPPKGISNAFNNGLNKQSGELVLFLNSGDAFVDENVIE